MSGYADRRVYVVGLLGFSSGIPLLLTSSTFSLRLFRDHGLSLKNIGFFGIATLPYAFKYVWAPLIDRLEIPFITAWLGRRRGWMLLSQFCLILSLWGLAFIDIGTYPFLTAVLVFCVSFSSASQDIVNLAYQAEFLGRETYGTGEAMSIFGYRMGMLLASGGALYLTSLLSWGQVYFVLSLFILVGVITVLSTQEPTFTPSPEVLLREKKAADYLRTHTKLKGWQASFFSWGYGAIVCPFIDFTRQKVWLPALLLMFFYKLGDNLIGTLSNIFYADLGFSDIEIANASKIFGMWTSILGGFIGGALIYRVGMLRSLMWFGLMHGMATLMFIGMAHAGKNLPMLYFSVALEHITSGMRTTALLGYQLTLCNLSYAATQLAMMTSLVHLGRTFFSSFSGYLADLWGWQTFFAVASFSTLPILGIILWLGKLTREPVFKFSPRSCQKFSRESKIQQKNHHEETNHAA